MPSQLATKKHAKYFQRLLRIMPNCSAEFDCSRLAVAFFAISGLDILNCLNDLSEETKLEAINWIYRLQITGAGPRSGFQPSTTIPKDAPKYQCGHLAMTYIGLVTLLILGDDLSRVDKKSIIEGMRACQNPDGSFTAIITGCESDMRFLYCACCISIILNDWSGIDKTKAIDYILKSIVSFYLFVFIILYIKSINKNWLCLLNFIIAQYLNNDYSHMMEQWAKDLVLNHMEDLHIVL